MNVRMHRSVLTTNERFHGTSRLFEIKQKQTNKNNNKNPEKETGHCNHP